MYQAPADWACNRIAAAITFAFADERPIKAMLDPANSTGCTAQLRVNTSRPRWQIEADR